MKTNDAVEAAKAVEEIEGLPERIEAVRTLAADEYHEHLKAIPTMPEHTAREKWVSFRTGFKYGYQAAEMDAGLRHAGEPLPSGDLREPADKVSCPNCGGTIRCVECGSERFPPVLAHVTDAPIDVVLFCPECKEQHVDKAEPDTCESCGQRSSEVRAFWTHRRRS